MFCRAARYRSGELVAEVKYLTWMEDKLLRQVVFEGLHEDRTAHCFASSKPVGPRRHDPISYRRRAAIGSSGYCWPAAASARPAA